MIDRCKAKLSIYFSCVDVDERRDTYGERL